MSKASGCAPEIGRWLWALQDARSRTLEELEGVTPAMELAEFRRVRSLPYYDVTPE